MIEHTGTDITNTQTRQREHVELAHATGRPVGVFMPQGSIEAQEKAGQTELVLSDLLPVDSGGDEPYIELGFAFGEPKADDPIFRPAALPEGWRREGSDHSMWSYLVDGDGYRCVAVFYKAAFYDRSAHMYIACVPATAAQTDAREEVHKPYERDGYAGPFWRHGVDRRDGADYIYVYRGCMGEDAALSGGFCHPHGVPNGFAEDGRSVEIRVAPDGTIVERRELPVEP